VLKSGTYFSGDLKQGHNQKFISGPLLFFLVAFSHSFPFLPPFHSLKFIQWFGERCKLPNGVRGACPGCKRITDVLRAKVTHRKLWRY